MCLRSSSFCPLWVQGGKGAVLQPSQSPDTRKGGDNVATTIRRTIWTKPLLSLFLVDAKVNDSHLRSLKQLTVSKMGFLEMQWQKRWYLFGNLVETALILLCPLSSLKQPRALLHLQKRKKKKLSS